MLARLATRPWKLALLWLAALTPFFFASYHFANWAASLRQHVPTIMFAWERHIPFLPWTIFPYWSTDLFYALSLFVCPTRDELNIHARRLLSAQILSVSIFLLLPLRFGVALPNVEGLPGRLFAALHSFDKPFNQAPSLHVCLTVLLWSLYSRHLGGGALWVMRGWMVLVGVATLTTYQHHFIDLPAGIWVGLLVMALLPFDQPTERPAVSRDPERFRIAGGYLAGAVIAFVAAIWLGRAGWWLLWPAGALLLVALIYASGDPGWFGKQEGSLAPPVAWLLGPYLLAARLNLLFWTREDAPAQEIADGVWLGRSPRRSERDACGIRSVVDLAAELPVNATGVRYRLVPMLDRLVPGTEQLSAAVAAIEASAADRPTLVCCAAGYSRAASALAAWLLATGRADSVEAAIDRIRRRRPRIVLSPRDRIRLQEWRHAVPKWARIED